MLHVMGHEYMYVTLVIVKLHLIVYAILEW